RQHTQRAPIMSLLRCLHSTPTFFFHDTPTTKIYTLSLHDALPIYQCTQYDQDEHGRRAVNFHQPRFGRVRRCVPVANPPVQCERSEEHTSELQSRENLVCRLLLEKKKKKMQQQQH